jgi:protoporphyrinogen oxidase
VRGLERGFRVMLESGEELTADRVVLAVPAEQARALVNGFPEAAARIADAARLPSSPIVTVTLWFEPAAKLPPLVGLLDPVEGFHWAFDRGAFLPARGAARPVVLVASAAQALLPLPTAEIVARARRALTRHGLTDAQPVASRVVKEPHATPAFTPAAAPARPSGDSGIPGQAFAGDWTATGLPATIESAVASGLTASAILGRPPATEAHA